MKNTNENKGLETSKTFDAIYEIEMVKEEEKAERENRAPDYESVTNKAYDLAYENGGLCTLAADTSTGNKMKYQTPDHVIIEGLTPASAITKLRIKRGHLGSAWDVCYNWKLHDDGIHLIDIK